MTSTEDSTTWTVVVNGEEQYSIWPEGREKPAGWSPVPVGGEGGRVELGEIEALLRVHDGFFEIGGNSLCAAQLQSEIYSRFGFEVNLQSLFADSTIAGLAEIIAGEQRDRSTMSDGSRGSG